MSGKLAIWGGVRLEELTKEQLIEALQYYHAMFKKLNSPESRRARALGEVEMIKRGEK